MKLYSHTTGYCADCKKTVTARIIEENGAVLQQNLCPIHGKKSTVISSDVEWYEASLAYVKPRQIPLALGNDTFSGCPHSCGLCPQHRQHTCLPIAEITSDCNLSCPVCLKSPDDRFGMSAAEYKHALQSLMRYEGGVPLINLSGGEPTLHPELEQILNISAELGVMQVSVSTNGLRLFSDKAIRDLFRRTNTIASLQFDGFDPETWKRLRGRDLSAMKQELVAMLEDEGIRYSLVATVAKGVNDQEIPAIADFFFASQALSLMFQPVAVNGAARASFTEKERLTIADVTTRLCESRHIKKGDFNPLPCSHFSCFALSYFFKIDDDRFYSLKDFLGQENFLSVIANRTLPGLDQEGHNAMRDRVYAFWSAADSSDDNARVLSRIKAILREMEAKNFSPKAAFDVGASVLKSVFIHHFMDAASFDQTRLMKCCNHYLRPDGSLVPMCAHNVVRTE